MATTYSGEFSGTINAVNASGISLADDAVLNIGGVVNAGDFSLKADGNRLRGFYEVSGAPCYNGLWETTSAMPAMLTNPMCGPISFFDDFVSLSYNSSLGTNMGRTWQETHSSTGSDYAVALATHESYGVGGVVSMSTNDSFGDSGDYVSFVVPGKSFYLSDGCSCDIWFEARIAISDVDGANGLVGLVAATSNLYTVAGGGIFFRWGLGSLDFVTEQGTTEDSCGWKSCDTAGAQNGTSFSDGEFVRLGFKVLMSSQKVVPYINGSSLAIAYDFTDSNAAWPLVALRPAFEIATSVDGEHQVMYVDYVKCVQIPHKSGRHIDIVDE